MLDISTNVLDFENGCLAGFLFQAIPVTLTVPAPTKVFEVL